MIPNQFHFVFGLQPQTEAFHLLHYLCLKSCLRVNQPEKVFFYYHYPPFGRYWELIKPDLELVQVPLVPLVSETKYRERFINRFRYAHHSDFIRLEKLVEHGGIYADMDTLFVNRIPTQLFEKPFVLGREPDIYDPNAKTSAPSLCNAFIMAEASAAFGRKWLEGMGEAFDGTWSNHSTLLPQRLSERHPKTLHIEPVASFYKFPGSRVGIGDLFERLQPDFEDVFSMHLWAHLWWSELRIDFSTFHAGLITEEYVRSADTTYAVAARRFLPEPRVHPVAVSLETKRGDVAGGGKRWLQHAKLYGLTLAKVVSLRLLGGRFYADADAQLHYAKKQLRFLSTSSWTKRRLKKVERGHEGRGNSENGRV